MTLAIARTYVAAYDALPERAKRAADDLARSLLAGDGPDRDIDAVTTAPALGIGLVRLCDDWEVAIYALADDATILLHAGRSEEVYRWARTKHVGVNPVTGVVQMCDPTLAARELTTRPVDARELGDPGATRPPFVHLGDAILVERGLPEILLPCIRAAETLFDVDRIAPHLPEETAELLAALAAGAPLDVATELALSDFAARSMGTRRRVPLDLALEHEDSRRTFRVVREARDLDACLSEPYAPWRTFLHPRQRAVVRAPADRTTWLRGGPGTGKSVAVAHRAAHLVREVFVEPDDRVLVATSGVGSTSRMRARLGALLEPDEQARVDVLDVREARGAARRAPYWRRAYRHLVADQVDEYLPEQLGAVRTLAGGRCTGATFASRSPSDDGRRLADRDATFPLHRSYRFTGALARTWSLLAGPTEGDERGAPALVALRGGAAPDVRRFASTSDQDRAAAECVSRHLARGASPRGIAVVCPDDVVVRRLRASLAEGAAAEVRVAVAREMLDSAGLELDAVLVVDVAVVSFVTGPLAQRRLLQDAAACTREWLHVFCAGHESPLLAPLWTDAPAPALGVERPLAEPPTHVWTSEDVGDVRGTRVEHVDLIPPDVVRWAHRHGLTTVDDLARVPPTTLLFEVPIRRGSVQDTRAALEGMLSLPWEQLSSPIEREPSIRWWDRWRATLGPWQRTIPLADVDLPKVVRHYAEAHGLRTVGDLAALDQSHWFGVEGVGVRLLSELAGLLAAHVAARDPEPWGAFGSLLDELEASLDQLEPALRMVATRRAGLRSPPESARRAAELLGVERSVHDDLERRAVTALRDAPWAERARVEALRAVHVGPIPLRVLARCPWWERADRQVAALRFLLGPVLSTETRLADVLGDLWLCARDERDLGRLVAEIGARARALRTPTRAQRLDAIVHEVADGMPLAARAHLCEALREQASLDPSDRGRVVVVHDHGAVTLVRRLQASALPLPQEIALAGLRPRLTTLPPAVLEVGPHLLALATHVPTREWREVWAPRVTELLRAQPRAAAWDPCTLIDELREEHLLPPWLTPSVVLAMARSDERFEVSEDGIASVETSARPAATGWPALEVALSAAGGADAIRRCADCVETLLARRERGLPIGRVLTTVRRLSAAHSRWSAETALAVLGCDGRFRVSRAGAIGLARWTSNRVPTRPELVDAALLEAKGRVSLHALVARMTAHQVRRPTLGEVRAAVHAAHARIQRGWVVRRPATTLPPLPDRREQLGG